MRAARTAAAMVWVALVTIPFAVAGCADPAPEGGGGLSPTTTVPAQVPTAPATSTPGAAPTPTPSPGPAAPGAPGAEAAVRAALAFAAEVVGLDDPTGEAVPAADPGTAQVDVRGRTGEGGRSGRPTVVLLERDGGDWVAVGTTAQNIVADQPAPGDAVTSPLTLRGRADAFEGTVTVAVKAGRDGGYQELGSGFVTGAMGRLGPFEGSVEFRAPPTPTGWVVFTEPTAADDGGPIAATTVPVTFE